MQDQTKLPKEILLLLTHNTELSNPKPEMNAYSVISLFIISEEDNDDDEKYVRANIMSTYNKPKNIPLMCRGTSQMIADHFSPHNHRHWPSRHHYSHGSQTTWSSPPGFVHSETPVCQSS